MLGRPSKNSLKFLAKNFDKCFKGLSDIKEQNQLHIWNQQVKHYQSPSFCDSHWTLEKKIFFSQKLKWIFWRPSQHQRKKLITYLESAWPKLPNVMLSEIFIFSHYFPLSAISHNGTSTRGYNRCAHVHIFKLLAFRLFDFFNFWKFITRKVLVLERSSLHQRV